MIMKKIDEREMQKTTKEKQTKAETSNENRSYWLNDFVVHLSSVFFELKIKEALHIKTPRLKNKKIFHLKIKQALHTNWRKPNLNAQQNHLAVTLSL